VAFLFLWTIGVAESEVLLYRRRGELIYPALVGSVMTTVIFLRLIARAWTLGLMAGLLSLCVLTAPAHGATNVTPKRVLILDSFGRDVAPFNVGAGAFRTTLVQELGEPVDIYEESLDLARFAVPETEAAFADFLEQRFGGRRLDLVVPIGAPAVTFAARYRNVCFRRHRY
jgi:hypothetical protein